MVSVIDSFSVNTTSGSFQSAVDSYTQAQTDAIEANSSAVISSLQTQIAAAQAEINEGFTRETTSGNIVNDPNNIRAVELRQQIDALNEQIAEQISRIGGSLQTATVDFSNSVLSSIAAIENISTDDAVTKLNQLTKSYEDNYFTLTEQITRANEAALDNLAQFSSLGIDETTR